MGSEVEIATKDGKLSSSKQGEYTSNDESASYENDFSETDGPFS